MRAKEPGSPVRILAMYGIFEPTPEHLERLRSAGGEVVVALDEASAIAAAPRTEVIFGHRFLRQTIPHAPHLCWVQTTASGVSQLPCAELLARGVTLSRTLGAAPTIARHAHTLAWSLQRNIPAAFARQKAERWDNRFSWLPAPKRAIVFGTGNIGRAIAALLRLDGIYTIGIKRTVRGNPLPEFCELHTMAQARGLLGTADWCFCALPNSSETVGWFSDDTLQRLPAHALFINVGHGQTVDSKALLRVLNSGHLGGVALDVVDTEPSPPSELWQAPRLLLTPHIAAHYAERQAEAERFNEEQFVRYREGLPLEALVDFVAEGLLP